MAAWQTRALSTPIAQHWTPISLRSGLRFVSLHSLETLRFTGTDLERVGEPTTAGRGLVHRRCSAIPCATAGSTWSNT